MMDISAAKLTDEAATLALWREAGLTRPWNDPSQDFVRAVQCEQSDVLLATEDDVVMGSVMVGDDGHRGWMYYLSVADVARGRGIGTTLVASAEEWFRGRGQLRVRLMVRAENLPVVAFYAGLGYEDQDCAVLGRTLVG
jgi:ribosomal protein S18 acetylase RimI-like enzyme